MSTPEQKYKVRDTLPVDPPNVVLEITPIKQGAETTGWLYICGEDYDHKHTQRELEEK